MKAHLSEEEKLSLNRIIKAAGVGCLNEIASLNEEQIGMLKNFQTKGYIMLTKKKFMVVLVPDNAE